MCLVQILSYSDTILFRHYVSCSNIVSCSTTMSYGLPVIIFTTLEIEYNIYLIVSQSDSFVIKQLIYYKNSNNAILVPSVIHFLAVRIVAIFFN